MRIVIPDLLPGTDYAIQVRADDGDGESVWSPRFEVTTAEDTTLPEVPTNVTWVVSGDSFYGEWDSIDINVNNDYALITRYELELVGNGVTKVVAVPQKTGSRIGYTLTFEDNRALFNSPAATVTMRVRAVDNKNLKGAYSAIKSATNPAPNPVTNLTATGVTDAVNLNWTAPSDNDLIGYNVYASVTNGFNPAANNKVGFTAGTQFQHTTSNYTTWHYVVRSVDKFGSESTITRASATPVSPFGVDATPPPVPTITAAVLTTTDATTRTSGRVDWSYSNPPSDLAEFVIRYRPAGQTPTAPWEYVTVPTASDALVLTATINNLLPYVNYEFSMQARDFTANESDWTAITTANAASNVAPSTPATPTASSNTQQIQVVHSGNRATGAVMEADVVEYEVYASTTSGFTPATANLLGKIPAGPAIVGTFNIPASGSGTAVNQRWYVKVIAVDRGGLKSAASGQAQADVGLISTANIGNAQVTTAKIGDLEVTKLTAGSGLITDFTVKSTLTLGDASTDGVIKSHGWSQGTAGWRLNKSGLEVNDGEIAAKALKIQNSQNLLPPQYADFEWGDSYYINAFWDARGQGKFFINRGLVNSNEQATAPRGKRQMGWTTFSDPGEKIAWLGASSTDYNIAVDAGAQYVYSIYLKNITQARTWYLRAINQDGTVFATSPAINLPANMANFVRHQFAFTIPAGTTKIMVGLYSAAVASGGSDLHFDAAQVERVEAGLAEASPWKPPAATTIEGAGIITGFLRSQSSVNVNGTNFPLWSINLAGNAQFGDAAVRGKLLVGPAGSTDGGNSYIASGNYVANDQGWKIKDDGIAEFANITSRAPGGTRIDIGNAVNPFESNQEWNVLQFFSANTAWSPAQIWVNYLPGTVNGGVMQIASPKLGTRDPAQIQLWSEEQTNNTRILLAAKTLEASASSYYFGNDSARRMLYMDSNNVKFTANTYSFGDPNGTALVFKMEYVDSDQNQTWSFRSPGNKRIDFQFGTLGTNVIHSKNENNARERLDLLVEDFYLDMSASNGNIFFRGASAMSNRPIITYDNGNSAIVLSAAEEVRMTSLNGGAYIDARAARWLTSSDMSFKSAVAEVEEPMKDKMRTLKVYDYDREPHEKVSAKDMRALEKAGMVRKKRYRGMSAQEIQKVMPEVIVDDEDGDSGLAVDVYGLLSNTIKALNELQDEVDDLKAQLASK